MADVVKESEYDEKETVLCECGNTTDDFDGCCAVCREFENVEDERNWDFDES